MSLRPKRQKNSLADRADPFELYERAVQAPAVDIDFFTRVFAAERGRQPLALREDFCGTAFLAAEWVRSDRRRSAVGVDHHLEVLAWSRRRALAALDAAERDRLTLICADVALPGPPVDIACALNFSFCALKDRQRLGAYFGAAFAGLVDDGVLFCELYGGTEAIIELEEKREVENFTFIWDQASFNPVTRETACHIHFEMSDGSRLDRAFSYDWRLWTIPEVRELLRDAGFAHTRVFWEQVDDEGTGTGEYLPTERQENQEGWLVYIVAFK